MEEIYDGATSRPVQWFFDNLLPEEGQRQLIARAAGATVEDAFALLEHFGAESAGSLTLLPPGQEPIPGNTQALSWNELSRRINEMPSVPLAVQTAKKMSLAGAQHKMAVIYRDDQLFEPTGSSVVMALDGDPKIALQFLIATRTGAVQLLTIALQTYQFQQQTYVLTFHTTSLGNVKVYK